jgi:hypothetical protein
VPTWFVPAIRGLFRELKGSRLPIRPDVSTAAPRTPEGSHFTDGELEASLVEPSTRYSNATPSGVVFQEPSFRGRLVGEDLEMVGIADLFAGVNVDQGGHRGGKHEDHLDFAPALALKASVRRNTAAVSTSSAQALAQATAQLVELPYEKVA